MRTKSTECRALTYDFAGGDFLLYFLKNGTGTLDSDLMANTAGNYSVTAVLQWSRIMLGTRLGYMELIGGSSRMEVSGNGGCSVL